MKGWEIGWVECVLSHASGFVAGLEIPDAGVVRHVGMAYLGESFDETI